MASSPLDLSALWSILIMWPKYVCMMILGAAGGWDE